MHGLSAVASLQVSMPSTVSQHDRHKQPHFESSELMAMSINIWRTSSRTMSKIGVRTMKRLAQGLRRCRDAFRRNSALAWAPNVDCVLCVLCAVPAISLSPVGILGQRGSAFRPRSDRVPLFRSRAISAGLDYHIGYYAVVSLVFGVWNRREKTWRRGEMEKHMASFYPFHTHCHTSSNAVHSILFYFQRLAGHAARTVRTVLEWADASQLLP